MISKNMVEEGYRAGLIRIVDSPNEDGAVCQIGEIWFYFGGHTAEEMSAKEYIAAVPEEDILSEIFAALTDFSDCGCEELLDEYLYYEMFLNEHGITN